MSDDSCVDLKTSASSDYQIRAIEESDIKQLVKLQLRVFSRKREFDEVMNQFQWKYFNNPVGHIVGALAENSEGVVVGMYGAIPLRVKIGNTTTVCNYVCTTAVDKDCRNKTIFKKMYLAFEQNVLRCANSSLCLGFPNPLAFEIGRRSMGYSQVLKIYTYLIPLRLSAQLEYGNPAARKNSKFYKIFKKAVRRFIFPLIDNKPYLKREIKRELKISQKTDLPEDYSSFWEAVSKDYQNIVIRDGEYLRWRIFQEPEKKYKFFEVRLEQKLVGYFVLEIAYETRVIDFLCFRKRELVDDIFYAMLRLISEYSEAYVVRFPVYDEFLEYAISANRAQLVDVSPLVYSCFSNNDHAVSLNFNNSAAWYLNGSEYFIA